jgi:hypothetical protein
LAVLNEITRPRDLLRSLMKERKKDKRENLYMAPFKNSLGRALVAHACNPSYSGGRDQEDCGSKPAWENSSKDPISKKPFTKKKKGLVEWL